MTSFHVKRHLLLTVVCIAMASLSACGGKTANKTSELKVAKESPGSITSSNKQETITLSAIHKEGLQLTIRPIHKREELKDLFALDLIKHGYFPAHISFANVSREGKVLCDPEDITLISPSGQKYLTISPEYAYDKSKKSYGGAVLIGLFWLPAAAAASASIAIDNAKMEENIVVRGLRRKALQAGESVEGHVFFKIPKERVEKLLSLNGWKIIAKISNLDNKTIEFEQSISDNFEYRGKKPLYLLKKEMARQKVNEGSS